jgi:hypothetical protein
MISPSTQGWMECLERLPMSHMFELNGLVEYAAEDRRASASIATVAAVQAVVARRLRQCPDRFRKLLAERGVQVDHLYQYLIKRSKVRSCAWAGMVCRSTARIPQHNHLFFYLVFAPTVQAAPSLGIGMLPSPESPPHAPPAVAAPLPALPAVRTRSILCGAVPLPAWTRVVYISTVTSCFGASL